MAKQPEDCQTMIEVREGVDSIDRELVRLLVTRQGRFWPKPKKKAYHLILRSLSGVNSLSAALHMSLVFMTKRAPPMIRKALKVYLSTAG